MPARPTDRGFDRFAFFSDAVVAIAISLFILPVVDAASDVAGSGRDFIDDNRRRLFAFFLSFVVIARFWVAHHRLFGRIDRQTPLLVRLNLAWLLSIVFLPLPTELLGVHGGEDEFSRALYIGSLLASSLILAVLDGIISASDDLGRDPGEPRSTWIVPFVMPALIALALVVSALFPDIDMWAMALLFLTGPVTALVERSSASAAPDAARRSG